MTTKKIPAVAFLVFLMTCPVALQAQSTDSGTPKRDSDGRVVPTANPHPKAYAWETVAERIETIDKANDVRNEALAKFHMPVGGGCARCAGWFLRSRSTAISTRRSGNRLR